MLRNVAITSGFSIYHVPLLAGAAVGLSSYAFNRWRNPASTSFASSLSSSSSLLSSNWFFPLLLNAAVTTAFYLFIARAMPTRDLGVVVPFKGPYNVAIKDYFNTDPDHPVFVDREDRALSCCDAAVYFPTATQIPDDRSRWSSWCPKDDPEYALQFSEYTSLPKFLFRHFTTMKIKSIDMNNPLNNKKDFVVELPEKMIEKGLGTRSFPCVIFSHGIAGSSRAYANYAAELASMGVVVICPTFSDSSAIFTRTSSTRGLQPNPAEVHEDMFGTSYNKKKKNNNNNKDKEKEQEKVETNKNSSSNSIDHKQLGNVLSEVQASSSGDFSSSSASSAVFDLKKSSSSSSSSSQKEGDEQKEKVIELEYIKPIIDESNKAEQDKRKALRMLQVAHRCTEVAHWNEAVESGSALKWLFAENNIRVQQQKTGGQKQNEKNQEQSVALDKKKISEFIESSRQQIIANEGCTLCGHSFGAATAIVATVENSCMPNLHEKRPSSPARARSSSPSSSSSSSGTFTSSSSSSSTTTKKKSKKELIKFPLVCLDSWYLTAALRFGFAQKNEKGEQDQEQDKKAFSNKGKPEGAADWFDRDKFPRVVMLDSQEWSVSPPDGIDFVGAMKRAWPSGSTQVKCEVIPRTDHISVSDLGVLSPRISRKPYVTYDADFNADLVPQIFAELTMKEFSEEVKN